MPAHRHASTAPGIRRPPRPSAWSLRAPRWASTGRPPTTAGSPPRNGGARPVSPPEPLPTGARLPVSVPACRWTVISNAFREPAGKNCVAKCATHFSLIGGKYRPLPRNEGVALVQAITILPPKGVSPLLDRGRFSDTLSGGCSRRRRFKAPFGSPPFAPTRPRRRPLRARDPAGSCAFAVAAIAWRFLRHPHAMAKVRRLIKRARTIGLVSCRLRRHPPSGARVSTTASLRPSLSSA
jgi:hypothetical protein